MDPAGKSRESNWPKVFLGLFAAGAVIIVASAGLVGYFGWKAFRDQSIAALEANPVIQQHIGTIESLELDFGETGAVEGDETFVFVVRGTVGAGTVTAELRTVDADTEELVGGELRLDDGRRYPLFPPEADPPPGG